ncbi:MAG: glycosyltransferase family 2 protein [Terriglobales bacterium]|jgi:cellulose synthase/poly-beta-1,6-N-acetylglucosamine synthase-like glycosyltransferase
MIGLLIYALVVFGTLLALCTLPGTLELLFLTIGGVLPAVRRRPLQVAESAVPIRTAIVVPAHDEEISIAACVKSLLECDSSQASFSVYVVADNCTDQTVLRAQVAGAQTLFRNDAFRRGKGYALDFAFRALMDEGFDLFIVVDADTSVTSNLVREFSTAIASGADALQCRYKVRNAGDSVRTRWMNIALMAFNVLRPRGRNRFGLSAGVLGNGFALTRATLEKVPYDAVSVVEDLEYHLRLVRAGLKVQFVDTVTVFGEMPSTGSAVVTQRSRWEGGRFRMMAHFAPALFGEVLRGRTRCLEPLLELLLLPLAFQVALLTIALATPVEAVRIYAACSLGVVLLHLLAAIAVGGGGWRDLLALASAPFYVIWKLKVVPQLLGSARKGAAWIRTGRADSKGGVR